MNYFITAIGTDSGKTLVSAIFCEAFAADYWKPVQSGMPRDTDQVKALVTNRSTVFHPETCLLKTPASPHAAAKIDGVTISISQFNAPAVDKDLIIEGAGGCLVPLNDTDVVVDLITLFNAQAIVVSNHYLGSINHTLLTLEALQKRRIPVKGIVFNGDPNPETERIILHHTNVKCLLNIKREAVIDAAVVGRYAALLKTTWHE